MKKKDSLLSKFEEFRLEEKKGMNVTSGGENDDCTQFGTEHETAVPGQPNDLKGDWLEDGQSYNDYIYPYT